jgi:hypothetical protein
MTRSFDTTSINLLDHLVVELAHPGLLRGAHFVLHPQLMDVDLQVLYLILVLSYLLLVLKTDPLLMKC